MPTLGVILFIAMAYGWLSECLHLDHVLIFQGILGVHMGGWCTLWEGYILELAH